MEYHLDAVELRVLGCLIEKELATPDYYPLSLNALINACNQKSNRDPVVAWDEETVETAVDSREAKGLINRSSIGRVPKFEETLTRQYNMVAAEAADEEGIAKALAEAGEVGSMSGVRSISR